jgi:DNA-binding transcriptional LysR family regulator
MDFNLLKSFLEICDSGSLSETARRRGVTRSQVSRELKTLETQLNTTLMRRTTRRLAVTEQGQTLYEHGLRILDECNSAQAAIDSLGQTVSGHVRLSIPTGLGKLFLQPQLLGFVQAHPGITLRVLFSNRVFDLLDAEIDVALRVTSTPPLDQVAKEICSIDWGLYATPAYLSTQPLLKGPEGLAWCAMVCPPYPGRRFMLQLHSDGISSSVGILPRVQSEHFPFLLDAVNAGTGIGLLPGYAVRDDVAAGRLVAVLPEWRPQGLGDRLFILTMPNRHPSQASRVLIDFLRASLQPLSAEATRA